MTDQHSILVSALPPSRNQIRLALIIALALLAAFLVTIPFRHVQLPAVTAFIPVVAAFLFINDLITAALLYAQFAVVRSRALLALLTRSTVLWSTGVHDPSVTRFTDVSVAWSSGKHSL